MLGAGVAILAVRAIVAFLEDAMGTTRAFAALGRDAQLFAQSTQGANAITGRFTDLALGDGMAYTDEHGVLQSGRLMEQVFSY